MAAKRLSKDLLALVKNAASLPFFTSERNASFSEGFLPKDAICAVHWDLLGGCKYLG